MTVMDCVVFFLGVSVLGLLATALLRSFSAMKQGIGALLKRQYRIVVALLGLLLPAFAAAQDHAGGGEANLTLPDLKSVVFEHFFGLNGHALLTIGLLFCVGGLLFGLAIYVQLKNLPVHRTMLEISDLIYETCKTYLVTQGKFILLLWAFIAVVISMYFGWLAPVPDKPIWVTPVSYTHLLLAGAVVLGAAIAWRTAWGRKLWQDPLFGASLWAVAGYLLFMTIQNHPQPRYFAVPAFFCFFLVALGAEALGAEVLLLSLIHICRGSDRARTAHGGG